MSLTSTDFFCGMGGSSTGLVAGGYSVKVAANHWGRAIETHSANHPDTEHLCADISQIDLRYLPKTDLLWASPICTEISPAGGRRKKGHQLDLFEDHGHVPTEAFERTRVTFWEVIRAAELHRYSAVLVENVVEAAQWELFDVWLAGMATLGYNHQFVSVSAAHVGSDTNDHAPQWRDRLYIAFTRTGIPLPDVDPRPMAWCQTCGHDVAAVQWWKKSGRRIGKYGPQYLYVCPTGHRDGIVEPYVAPAAAAIDWTNPGTRIGDRARPLGAATMRRIQVGLDTIGNPALVAAAGSTSDAATGHRIDYMRAWPLDSSPTPSQVTTAQNGVATTEPFIAVLRRNSIPTPTTQPAATFSAGGFHHGLTIPPGSFLMKQYGGRLRHEDAVKPTDQPLSPAVARSAPTLVIPYRKGAKPYPTGTAPLSTMATRDQHALLAPAVTVEDCYFRMLTPREAATAQRFPRSYVIHGNQGEQQMQAGNAVAVNVAQWLGGQVAKVLA